MKENIVCPNCNSKSTIKKGRRKSKLQTTQKYKCNDCCKIFTPKELKHKSYPAKIILNAISSYNLGNTLEASAKLINSRFKTNLTAKNVQLWVNEFKKQLPFSKLRKEAIKLCNPKNIIKKLELSHIQPYTFKYHKAKLYLLFHSRLYNNQFHNIAHFYEPLKQYLEKIGTDKFPHHIFTYDKSNSIINENKSMNSIKNNATSVGDSTANSASGPDAGVAQIKNIDNKLLQNRASQIKFNHLKIEIKSKNNFACKLAKLALSLAANNKDRHESIQDFFLINDSTTIAIEVPVHLTNWDAGYFRNQNGFIFPLSHYTTPITGHIDILQVRNGLIIILDYKPDAQKQNPSEQLTIYALALSRKLNLPLYCFKCAWFDENNYFEFYPLHAVYERKNNRHR